MKTLNLHLHTNDPRHPVMYGAPYIGYHPMPITRETIAREIVFPECTPGTGWSMATIRYVSVTETPAGSPPLLLSALRYPIIITPGVAPRFAAGDFSIVDADWLWVVPFVFGEHDAEAAHRHIAEMPAGERVEFLRRLGKLLRAFAPAAADELESFGA